MPCSARNSSSCGARPPSERLARNFGKPPPGRLSCSMALKVAGPRCFTAWQGTTASRRKAEHGLRSFRAIAAAVDLFNRLQATGPRNGQGLRPWTHRGRTPKASPLGERCTRLEPDPAVVAAVVAEAGQASARALGEAPGRRCEDLACCTARRGRGRNASCRFRAAPMDRRVRAQAPVATAVLNSLVVWKVMEGFSRRSSSSM